MDGGGDRPWWQSPPFFFCQDCDSYHTKEFGDEFHDRILDPSSNRAAETLDRVPVRASARARGAPDRTVPARTAPEHAPVLPGEGTPGPGGAARRDTPGPDSQLHAEEPSVPGGTE